MIIRPFDVDEDVGLLYTSNIRPEDADELMAGTGMLLKTILDAITLPTSETWIVTLDDGQLIAVGGLATSKDNVGVPWMVATDLFDKHYLSFIKLLLPKLKGWLDSHYALMNYVDVRNVRAIKFLKWLGFRFPKGQGYPMGGTYFQAFIQRGGKQDV